MRLQPEYCHRYWQIRHLPAFLEIVLQVPDKLQGWRLSFSPPSQSTTEGSWPRISCSSHFLSWRELSFQVLAGFVSLKLLPLTYRWLSSEAVHPWCSGTLWTHIPHEMESHLYLLRELIILDQNLIIRTSSVIRSFLVIASKRYTGVYSFNT